MTFIKFNDNNPNIVIKSSMKTLESVESVGAGSLVEAGALIDALNGIKAGTFGAVEFAGYIGQALLETKGQFSFDVETKAISTTQALSGSVGDAYANNTYLFTNGQTSGEFGRGWIDAGQASRNHINSADAQITPTNSHSFRNGRFTRMVYSWDENNNVEIYKNYRIHGTGTRVDLTAGVFDNFWLASFKGFTSGGTNLTLQASFIRDFILATTPVKLELSPYLPNLRYFGDSYISQADVSGNANYYRNNARHIVDAYMAERGILISSIVDGHPGATINDSSGLPLENFRAAFIATNPDPAVLQAGVNDALQATFPTTYEVDLDDHINSILGGGTPFIFVGTVPTVKFATGADTPAKVANVAEANNITLGAPARWDAANPLDTGRVVSYDLFNYLGGENPEPDVFVGQWNGLNDDPHLTAKGQKMMGEIIGATVYNKLLNNPTPQSRIIRNVIRNVVC